jgi:Protein of unknown function (DUF2721)
MFESLPTTTLSVTTVADIVRLAVAPVFLLSGIGAFLNVCVGRLSRIVDRSREIEPLVLASRGSEHDRWVGELKTLDRRMSLVSWATALSVFSAVVTCLVVALLFVATLTKTHFATILALLFIIAMLSIAAGFTVFLLETWVGSRAVRVRSDLLQHQVDEAD